MWRAPPVPVPWIRAPRTRLHAWWSPPAGACGVTIAIHPSSAEAPKHQEVRRHAQVRGEAVGVCDRRAGPCPRPRGGSEGRTVTVRVEAEV